ncbi:hypothetical protein [Pseudomonas sp. RA_35y_Pfl2_P32]|uniref:hypothetical protein n=1 Tax=Pseudomonas sp. RA_35y_Pfl2_P32 TaxID=3088705 RepID=UPI0030D76EAE
MNKSDGPDENCPVTLRPVEIAAQLAQIDANNYNNDFAYSEPSEKSEALFRLAQRKDWGMAKFTD